MKKEMKFAKPLHWIPQAKEGGPELYTDVYGIMNFYWELAETNPSAKRYVESYRKKSTRRPATTARTRTAPSWRSRAHRAGEDHRFDGGGEALRANLVYDHYKGKQWWRKCDNKAFQDMWIFKGRSALRVVSGDCSTPWRGFRVRGPGPHLRGEGSGVAGAGEAVQPLPPRRSVLFDERHLSRCARRPSLYRPGARMIYVLLAIGLSLIFGLMTVVNFSHGAFYMLGAYFGFFLSGSRGTSGSHCSSRRSSSGCSVSSSSAC